MSVVQLGNMGLDGGGPLQNNERSFRMTRAEIHIKHDLAVCLTLTNDFMHLINAIQFRSIKSGRAVS